MTFFLGLLLFLHITITFFLVYSLKTYQLRADCIEPVYPKVSVIICAKNEADHLKENLPKILAQHYPDYEVIVVNDNSTDDTETILNDLSTSFPRLRSFTYFKKNDESQNVILEGKDIIYINDNKNIVYVFGQVAQEAGFIFNDKHSHGRTLHSIRENNGTRRMKGR